METFGLSRQVTIIIRFVSLDWWGERTAVSRLTFLNDLKGPIKGHIQLTTNANGHKVTVGQEFQNDKSDYAMVKKVYGTPWYNFNPNRKYLSGVCTGVYKTPLKDNPKSEDICTSWIELDKFGKGDEVEAFTGLNNRISKQPRNMKATVAITLRGLQLLPVSRNT